MWYLAVILVLAVALATAGLIQVLWLEFAFKLDGTVLPHEGVADESSKPRHEAGPAHPDTWMSDSSG